jgi:hypothetical protein
MHKLKIPLRLGSLGCAALALLFGSGCVTMKPEVYSNSVAYQPEKSPTRIDATAIVQIKHTLSPEVRAVWKKWMNSDTNIENYEQGLANVIRNDIVESGVFARVEPGAPSPDFFLTIASEERKNPDGKLVVQLELRTRDQRVVSRRTRETPLGMTMSTYNMKASMPAVLIPLKADMVADIVAHYRQREAEATRTQAATFQQAPLTDLVVSADRTVETARARNRAIIAAKNQQFPAILRDHKTAELAALVVRFEQTILDLNHESEVAKDRAQQAMANNGAPGQIDELRGFAISYRERIELLKPILAALKEEIANRSR